MGEKFSQSGSRLFRLPFYYPLPPLLHTPPPHTLHSMFHHNDYDNSKEQPIIIISSETDNDEEESDDDEEEIFCTPPHRPTSFNPNGHTIQKRLESMCTLDDSTLDTMSREELIRVIHHQSKLIASLQASSQSTPTTVAPTHHPRPSSHEELVNQLYRRMNDCSPTMFELYCAFVFRCKGYIVEEHTGGAGDHGIDLRLRRRGMLVLVQCKQYKRQNVGEPDLERFYGTMTANQAVVGYFVTTTSYTKAAKQYCRDKTSIKLMGKKELLAYIERYADEIYEYEQDYFKRRAEDEERKRQEETIKQACPVCYTLVIKRDWSVHIAACRRGQENSAPPSPLLPSSSATTTTPAFRRVRNRKPWTDQEVEQLCQGIKTFGLKWTKILNSYEWPTHRKPDDLRIKWKLICSKTPTD